MRPGSGLFSRESCPSSIVSAEAFHFRVRDGNGWSHLALTTKTPNRLVKRTADVSPAGARKSGPRPVDSLVAGGGFEPPTFGL